MHRSISRSHTCIRFGTQCYALPCTRRAFRTGHILLNQAESLNVLEEPTINKRGPKKTKKKFSELPTQFIKPDGSLASPLPEWTGGLEVPLITETVGNLHTLTVDPRVLSKLVTAPKKRSKKKKELDASTNEQDIAQGEGDTITELAHTELSQKPKRKKRSKSSEPTPLAVDETAIQNVTAKPKRQRRSKSSETMTQAADLAALNEPDTPLARDVLGNLARFPHCILLTRVGQFYESYFDQAAEVSRLLNIKLTTRPWGGQRIAMCGFPLAHLHKYLKILVQNQKRFVAICEEFIRDRTLGPKGGFERRVTRIVTPGTLIDEPFLNPYENNYLLAVTAGNGIPPTDDDPRQTSLPVGLAWIDISTGDFFTQRTTLQALRDELVRIGPKEVVLDEILRDDPAHDFRMAIEDEGFFVSFATSQRETEIVPQPSEATDDDITSHLGSSVALRTALLSDLETNAVKLLTAFMHDHLLEHMPRLSSPSRESTAGRMHIDSHTIKALEIRESMREGGTAGSLLSVIKKTVTTSGTRLLARWLCSPSISVAEINTRQSLVALFKDQPHLRADLIRYLKDIEDAARIVQKFLFGRGDPGDLLGICNTINVWTTIRDRILLERSFEQRRGDVEDSDWTSLDALMARMTDLSDLARTIDNALSRQIYESVSLANDEDATGVIDTSAMYGDWTIKPEFSEQLTSLHATLADLINHRETLERRLQAEYDAPSLTLKSNPSQGLHVHLGKSKRDQSKIQDQPQFIKLYESGSTSAFFNQEWFQLGTQIMETTAAIITAEREAFETLRNEVNAHTATLRKNARIIDELDVTLAFANLAEEMNFVRPVIREDTSYHVVNGRHPTVELGLLTSGRVFTPNTVSLVSDAPLHIITGPNMAGKSTLLRQTALITILAQTGSFVPADSAEIGIVDRVFSRVGAKDDLFRDRSTFMVEMLETADILRRATPRSLVIMDEVGRGTTVDDGLAVAFACINHLLSINGCRTLFATHFHELADMLGYCYDHRGTGIFKAVQFYCTTVDEAEDGYFAYSHRLRPGVNRDSHGLKVAQLAGMPPSAIQVAAEAMTWLKANRSAQFRSKAEFQSLGQMLTTQGTETSV